MGASCPTCGAETDARFRLCGNCGTPLEGAASVEELQRFATVVTSDLKGSTALGEKLDPETLREVLTLYFDEMQAVFRSHGGTIEKIIGDAIVAVFGLPVRHDDDALRAVEAASESQRVLAVLNDRLEERWGVRLVVRTGVATGIVVFGAANEGQHVLTGDTMQMSTAMEQNAPPLEVLIAGSTYDAVRDSVVAEEMAPVTPKGWLASVPAYRLVSVAPRAAGPASATEAAQSGERTCPTCGEANPESFRLCGMCGATLAVSEPARESRRTVTVVFADPKPSTQDGSAPSAEALRDVMSRYFEVMKQALEAHGGTVEKFIGDAVMAVFGLPVRHEDDAVRAIRGAAAMQAALPALNEGFRATWGVELANHIGVNTGEVIAGDATLGQRLVTGDTVNTAARLEQAAGAREIVIGGLTWRLARDEIEVEAIPPLTLKGKAEPVPAYRLVRVAERPTERATTTPFVGREEELTRLETTLVDVSATRSCQLVTVIGDAGVGKSRLVREFATRAGHRDRAQVLRGRCLPYGDGVTFWPISEIVRREAGILDEDPREVALAKIAAIASRAMAPDDDPAMVVDRVAAAIGLSTTVYPGAELFWGIRRLLEAIASRRPLVAIVDDIHVAAPTFLELLDHLLESVHGSPILLLTTARRELLEVRAEWAETHEDEQMVLEPLSAGESDAIVEQLLTGLDASVRERIIGAAEGNPLYVEQITAMLIDTGAIRREGDGWAAVGDAHQIDIPPTIQALVASRIDALRSEERQVVDPASVIGLGFAVEAVASLIPSDAAAELPARLDSLTAKQLVRPADSDSDFYRFGHAVIKDSAYRSLLKRTRAELHERFVQWAEPINRERGRETEFEEILGYHLEQAFQYRGDLGPLDDAARDVGRRASEKLASAGRRAFGRGDAPAAANLLRRAAALLPELDMGRIELMTEVAEAEIEQGRFEDAGVAVEIADAAARTVDDSRLVARARLIRDQLKIVTTGSAGEPEAIAADVKAMLPLFDASGDLAGLARSWRLLWVVYGTSGALEASADAASRVAEIAFRSGEKRLAARAALNYAQAVLESPMPVATAIERTDALSEAVELDRIAAARFLSIRSVLHAMRGDFETARSMYRRSHELMAEVGTSVTASGMSLESSRVEMLANNPEAALHELLRDLHTLEALDETYYRSSVAGLLGHVLYRLDRIDEADQYTALAESLASDDDVYSQVIWRTARAKLDARQGHADDVVAGAMLAVSMAETTSYLELLAEAQADLADVFRTLGRHEDEGAPLREALILFEQKGDVVSAASIRNRIARLEGIELRS